MGLNPIFEMFCSITIFSECKVSNFSLNKCYKSVNSANFNILN